MNGELLVYLSETRHAEVGSLRSSCYKTNPRPNSWGSSFPCRRVAAKLRVVDIAALVLATSALGVQLVLRLKSKNAGIGIE